MSEAIPVAFRPWSTRAVSWGVFAVLGLRLAYIALLGGGLNGELSLSPRRPLSPPGVTLSNNVQAVLQAIALSDAGNYEESAKEIREVLKREPSALGHNGLGVALLHLGKTDQALKEFDAAVHIDPHFTDAYSNRADLRSQAGDAAGARADYDEVIELAPKAPGELAFAYFGRAQLAARTAGGRKAAIEDLQSALDAAPSDWPEKALAENALFRLRRGEPASREAKR